MQSPSLGFLFSTCGDILHHHRLRERQTGKNFNFGLQKKQNKRCQSHLLHGKLTIDHITGAEIGKNSQ